MTRFLSIETSADACSVSLILPDAIRSLETGEPRSHARLLVPLIRELLDGDPTPLDGICVDHGPGSYTGLRIGVSTAKGLAWALDRPLHALSSLALLAAAALEDDPAASGPVRALIPTRGKECFTALYAWEGGLWSTREAPRSADPASLMADTPAGALWTAPAGVDWPEEWEKQGVRPAELHSRHAAPFLRNQSESCRVQDAAAFEPLYIRSFVARKASVSIFDRLPF